jgi:hypothetical protein
MCKKSVVIARVTLTHSDRSQTVIEVDDQASFQEFYRWYRRDPGQRVKHLMRTSMRSDAESLEALAQRTQAHFDRLATAKGPQYRQIGSWQPRRINSIKLVVIKKKLYKKVLSLAPNLLPGGGPAKAQALSGARRTTGPTHVPVSGYTPLAKRWQLLMKAKAT